VTARSTLPMEGDMDDQLVTDEKKHNAARRSVLFCGVFKQGNWHGGCRF
jgi:hypothetical protein